MTDTEKCLSIVIPVYNESENIRNVLDDIKKLSLKVPYEILVVDDGSNDNTSEIAKDNGAKVIRFEQNRGKGSAMIEGIKNINGDIIIFMDGDGQDNAEDIIKLVMSINNGADFVNGSRFLGIFEEGSIKKSNFYITLIANKLISLLFKHEITDCFAGFRAFKTTSIKNMRLESKEYEIETEMLIKSIILGLDIVEIPVTRSKRFTGDTKLSRFRHGKRIIGMVLKYYFQYIFKGKTSFI